MKNFFFGFGVVLMGGAALAAFASLDRFDQHLEMFAGAIAVMALAGLLIMLCEISGQLQRLVNQIPAKQTAGGFVDARIESRPKETALQSIRKSWPIFVSLVLALCGILGAILWNR